MCIRSILTEINLPIYLNKDIKQNITDISNVNKMKAKFSNNIVCEYKQLLNRNIKTHKTFTIMPGEFHVKLMCCRLWIYLSEYKWCLDNILHINKQPSR